MPTYMTWVVAANATHSRAFEERRRGGELNELASWDCRQSDSDRRHAQAEKAVQGQRFGFGRSVVNLHDFDKQAERRFLARYAGQLELARAAGRFEQLIILAPPQALGMLRKELGHVTQRCLELTHACDCVEETPEKLRERIRRLREEH